MRNHRPSSSKPRGTPRLIEVRRRIDRLDERLLTLVTDRARMALEIGRIKKSRKWPVYDAKREAYVLRHMTQLNRGPLSTAAVRHIFQSILNECRRRQRRRSRKAA